VRFVGTALALIAIIGCWTFFQSRPFSSLSDPEPIEAMDTIDSEVSVADEGLSVREPNADATEVDRLGSPSDSGGWWQSSEAHGEFLAAFQTAIPDVRAWDLDTSTPGALSTMNLRREDAIEAARRFLLVEGEFAEVNGFQYQGKTFLLTLKGSISRAVQGRNLSFERFQSLPDKSQAAFEREPWTKPAASFLSDWGEEGATHHFDPELESLRRVQWKYIVERARIEAELRLLGHAASRARYATVGKEAVRPPTDADSEYTPAEYMALWDELDALPLLFQREIEAEAKRLGH